MPDLDSVTVIVDEGLGNSAYLIDLGDGRGLAVDPSRDLRALDQAARRGGVTIAYAADTHLHADFVTGATDLAARGATVLASAAGGRDFAHRGLHDGDDVDLGGLTLRALTTPGHTDEHVAFVLLDGSRSLAVFTGGSLIVGAAARTDLVDPARTEELARAQHASVRRLVALLPDDTVVYPTHGAGSFCAAPPNSERTTTIGREKASNPLLAASADDFVTQLLAAQGSYPPYFRRLAEVNRRGPAPVAGLPRLTPLSPSEVAAAVRGGAQLVDVRPAEDFAEGHVPGALSIALRPVFATWLGWLADENRPLVFVRNDDQDPEEIGWQCLKIGFERLGGELAGGMAGWRSAGFEVEVTSVATPGDLDAATVLDVRQDSEFAAGHVPGAVHIELGRLADVPTPAARTALPPGPVAVMCGHGERAMTAASLLQRQGHRSVAAVTGVGPAEWSRATGRSLERAE